MQQNFENYTKDMSYEDKMLYAFVGKPDKFMWYKKAFAKYDVYGVKEFAWNWSWYAFFFTFFYLLYRKVYKVSIILGGFYLIIGSIGGPLGFLINIILGGTLPYYVYERYLRKKQDIEMHISDENLRIGAMKIIGGVNKSIIPLTVVLSIILVIFYLMIILSF